MKKRILVIGPLDGFGNSVRPRRIQRFLTDRGHETENLEEVDQLAFPWDSFARDAVEQYGISGHGSLHLSWDSTLRLLETLLEGTS